MMNILDIIIIIPLLWAVYKGYKEGVLVQLGGILGLVIGVWLASKFGAKVGSWLHISQQTTAEVVGFIIVLVAVLLSIALIGRITRGLFKLAGLETLDTVGGVIFSVIKIALIISILLCAFDSINNKTSWVKSSTLNKSVLYSPVKKMASYAFPYIDSMRSKLLENNTNNTDKAE